MEGTAPYLGVTVIGALLPLFHRVHRSSSFLPISSHAGAARGDRLRAEALDDFDVRGYLSIIDGFTGRQRGLRERHSLEHVNVHSESERYLSVFLNSERCFLFTSVSVCSVFVFCSNCVLAHFW